MSLLFFQLLAMLMIEGMKDWSLMMASLSVFLGGQAPVIAEVREFDAALHADGLAV